MADKPTEFPLFATNDVIGVSGQPNISPPDLPHTEEGWIYQVPVNRQYLNWLHRLYNEWLQWCEQEIVIHANTLISHQMTLDNHTITLNNHTSTINNHETRIGVNEGNISNNSTAISNNSSAIGTNAFNIGNNTTNIGINDSKITDNINDIITLDGRMDTAESDISNNNGRLDNINFRTGNIAVTFNTFVGGMTAIMEYIRIGRQCTLYLPERIDLLNEPLNTVSITPTAGGNWPNIILPKTSGVIILGVIVIDGNRNSGAYVILDNKIQLMKLNSGNNEFYDNMFVDDTQCGMPEQTLVYTSRFD